MKTSKKALSVFLAVLIAALLPLTAFAAENTNRTSALLAEIAETGKLSAKVTSFSYESGAVKNDITFTVYDDIKANKICADFEKKGFKLIYDDSTLSFVIPRFFSYLSISGQKFAPIQPVMSAVDTFQRLFDSFLEDPDLTAFRFSEGKETVDGKELTCEYFVGAVIGVVGRFYYNDNDELVRLDLEDNAGAYISFTLEGVSNTFDDSVFTVPSFFFNLSILFKLLYLIFFASALK